MENRIQFKTNLIQFLNHEFKTPLNAMSLKLEMLKLKSQSLEWQNDLQVLESINRNILNITEAFLDQNLMHNHATSTQVSLVNAINEILTIPKLLAQKANVSVTVDTSQLTDISILIDRNAIQMILNNLVSNAIKFSPNGNILIRINGRLETTDYSSFVHLTFTVIDDGIGITEHEISNIQAPLWRSENALNTEGQGLGLAVVKTLLDGLGSHLSVTSAPDKGTEISFTVKVPTFTQP